MFLWIVSLLIAARACRCQSFATEYEDEKSATNPLRTLPMFRPQIVSSAMGSISDGEMHALNDLYYSTRGNNWAWKEPYTTYGYPWNVTTTEENPCTRPWQGITCILFSQPDAAYAISEVELVEYNLQGTLPESLSMLTQLNTLEITNNPLLVGSIPSSLGNLSQLQVLNFVYNGLTGTLPSTLGNLSQLVTINLYTNYLRGTLPRSLGRLSDLQYMGLAINSFTGSIPESFGELSQLKYMYLSTNKLSSVIPNSLGKLSQLQVLDLQINSITGTIPSSLGNLSQLSTFNLYTMQLTGSIPTSLGNLSNLYFFSLENNKLTGTIPETICNLSKLNYLNFENNHLTGTLPHVLSNLTQLSYLELDTNFFTGSIPNSFGQLSHLRYLYLDTNSLTGTIPASIGLLSELQTLHIYDNLLSGSIPQTFSKLVALQELLIKDNKLVGTLDDVINATTQVSLNTVQVENNQLTGTLPAEIFYLPKLITFVADSNCFHGTLPLAVCDATAARSILLNGLSSATSCQRPMLGGKATSYLLTQSVHGKLPSCVFALPNLLSLQFSGNGFTGSLSEGVTISTTLLDLALSHNELSGSIPRSIQEKNWYNLDLSFNRFSGSLLNSFASNVHSSNATISLENNRISGKIPRTVKLLPGISMLGSNLFTCDADRSELPRHDEGRHNYQCGSNVFNVPYYVWMGLVAICAGVAFVWTTKGASDLNSKWSAQFSLGAFSRRVHTLCRIAQLSTAYIVVILLPVFCVCNIYYGTFLHSYAWSVSAAFLSGTVPFSLELVLFTVLLVVMVCVFTRKQCFEQSEDSATVLVENSQNLSRKWRSVCIIYGAYILLNAIVVFGVNATYVYVAVFQSNDFQLLAQVLLSFFKIGWNSLCAPIVLKLIATQQSNDVYSELQYSALQIFVVLGNNIVIPCIVEASISPSCFYNVFIDAPEVKSHYEYETCISVSTTVGDCLKYAIDASTTRYSPPFTYSYQCSASLITHYTPAFVSMCIVNTFVVPSVQLTLQYIHIHTDANVNSVRFRILDMLVPILLKPTELGDGSHNDLNLNRVVVSLVSYLGLILTFGAVFPPLAPAFLVTIVAIIYFTQYKVCNFVANAQEQKHVHIVEIVERECKAVGNLPILMFSMWMLVAICACFYTLFLFEILGDAMGLRGSYWVLITVPLLPLCLYIAHTGYSRLHGSLTTSELKTENVNVGIELPAVAGNDEISIETYNVMISPSPV